MPLGKKYGGRKKGTPNKSTELKKRLGKEAITELLSAYDQSGLMASDFNALKPKDRIFMAEKLFAYIVPKMQATSVDINSVTQEKRLVEIVEDLVDDDTECTKLSADTPSETT